MPWSSDALNVRPLVAAVARFSFFVALASRWAFGLALLGLVFIAFGGFTSSTWLDLLKIIGYMVVVTPIILVATGIMVNAGLLLATRSFRLPSVLVSGFAASLRVGALYGLWLVLIHSNAIGMTYGQSGGALTQYHYANVGYFLICAPFVVYFVCELVEELFWMVLGPFVGHPTYRAYYDSLHDGSVAGEGSS